MFWGIVEVDDLFTVSNQTHQTFNRETRPMPEISILQPAVLNGPRTLDLDLIQVGDPAQDADLHGVYGELVLPHPRAHQRSFVLEPWYDVQPWAVLRTPQGPVPVGELLAARSAQERGTSW